MLFDAGCVICGETPGPVCCTCRGRLTAAAPLEVPGVDACRLGFALDEDSRTIVAAFKYRRQRRIARWLAAELSPKVPRCADVISWVPATPERRRSRGFDQAEQLALALSAQTGVPAVRLIGRDRRDQRQTGRTRQERLAAGPNLHATRTSPDFVVLVDDVITTGSSMSAAARVVRAASATHNSQRIVAVVAAATPALREVCLHESVNRSSIRSWT